MFSVVTQSDRYVDIYSNALNMGYNDEKEEGQSDSSSWSFISTLSACF